MNIRRPTVFALQAAESIMNYCRTRFPCDTPPHPMLDLPWLAEKIQRAIDMAASTDKPCAAELWNSGEPSPRTCERCGIGPHAPSESSVRTATEEGIHAK